MRKVFIYVGLVLVAVGAAAGHATATSVRVVTVMLAPTATGDPDASGVAVLRIDVDGQEVCYDIVVRDIDQPVEPSPGIGSAHIHGPGGGIAVDLETQFRTTGTDTYIATGCASASADTIEAILTNPEQYYVNVHTASFPAGAIQGSLGG
jgi:hypothetical protein